MSDCDFDLATAKTLDYLASRETGRNDQPDFGAPDKPVETIALLRPGAGLDFDDYVARVFRSADTAHRFAAKQYRNLRIVRVPGRVKVGDRVDCKTRCRNL